MSEIRFLAERDRIVSALGAMADGGSVEDVQHIGATRILGEAHTGVVDLALAAFPMDEAVEAKLRALGYVLYGTSPDQPAKQFRHISEPFDLTVIESGDEAWGERIITRDYLIKDPAAHTAYAAERPLWQADPGRKERFFRDAWVQAQTWWIETCGFTPLNNLAAELEGLQAPWHMVGGWALDLYVGRVRRVHHDLDIEIAYADQLVLREHMTGRGWKFVTPYDKRLEVWQPHMRLEPPRHQAHAHRDGAFLDFLLSDIQNGVWRYRRDPTISAVTDRINLKTGDGIPYLAPEIVLLFKSRNTSGKERGKDQTDFQATLPHLEPVRRAWLRWALLVTNPAHPWIEPLSNSE